MNNKREKNGFSLTEILLAIGTLAIGMLLVAGLFPAGMLFSTVAEERTIAAAVADEAFAKIRIIAGGANPLLTAADFQFDGMKEIQTGVPYPSADGMVESQQKYYWCALGRRTAPSASTVQVTVFVCRKIGTNVVQPQKVDVGDPGNGNLNELQITGNPSLINAGYPIVDDETGRIYRVLERDNDTIRLDSACRRQQGGVYCGLSKNDYFQTRLR